MESNSLAKELEELQILVIQCLKNELEAGDTTNINVANTLLTANKVVVDKNEGNNTHAKIKKIMQRKKQQGE